MSGASIREAIRQLNRLDVDRENYDYILSLIVKAVIGAVVHVHLTPAMELYFRARVYNEGKLTDVADLGAPPAHLVSGFQRCNRPGVPMFYSASKRITALLECDVREGDKVYLGQWINRKPVPVNTILSGNDMHRSIAEPTTRDGVLYAYIDTICTRPVHQAFSNAYKITAAIAESITARYEAQKDLDIREDGLVGIIYPSVTNIAASYNTAFHAGFAEQRLEILHVMEAIVIRRNDRSITLRVLDNAIEFPDGKIAWLGEAIGIPRLRENPNEMPFRYNGKGWKILVREDIATEEEMEQLLNEDVNGM